MKKWIISTLVGTLIGNVIAVSVCECSGTKTWLSKTFWQTSEPFRIDGLVKYEEDTYKADFINLETKEKTHIHFHNSFGLVKVFEDGEAYVSGRKTDWNWYNVEVHLPPSTSAK